MFLKMVFNVLGIKWNQYMMEKKAQLLAHWTSFGQHLECLQ